VSLKSYLTVYILGTTTTDGSVYTGEWKEGKYHGLGGT